MTTVIQSKHNFIFNDVRRGVVLCCKFHPSQLLLISGGDDSQVKVWDLNTKTCVSTLQAHFSAVTSLSITEDGWTLLTGGRDGVVVVWNLRNYAKVTTVPVFEAVERVLALPVSRYPSVKLVKNKVSTIFATGGEKGQVKFWRSDTATCISSESNNMPAASAAGSIVELVPTNTADASFGLLAATEDCRLLLLNCDFLEIDLHRQFIGNHDEVTDLRFLDREEDDGIQHLAVATNSEQIHILDSNSLSCVDTLTGHEQAVLALDYTKTQDGVMLLSSGSKDTTVRIWKVHAGKGSCVAIGTGHVGAVTSVAFSHHRKKDDFLVSVGSDKLLRVWDISQINNNDNEKALSATAAVPAHEKDINAVCISPNDALVATASQDRSIKIWKMPDLTPTMTLRGHKRGVWDLRFSPVDQALVSASGDRTLKLWNLKDGSCIRTFEGHLASVLRVGFLSVGTQLISAGADGLLKLWNIRTAEAVKTFDAHDDKVWALSLGDVNGDLIATGGADGTVAIWKDCTEQDKQTAAEEAEMVALKEQDLDNAIYSQDWSQAVSLAIDMGRPGQLLGVVNKALQVASDQRILEDVSRSLDVDKIRKTLEYCREWNTNSKNCAAAQAMLHAILRTHSQEELLSVPGLGPILDGLQAYTQRHTARLDRLMRSSFVVDFILGVMGTLTPSHGDTQPTKHASNRKRKQSEIAPSPDIQLEG